MNIGILVAGLPPERLGGAEIQAAKTAALLAERHDVVVYTRTRKLPAALQDHPRCTVLQRTPVDVRFLRFPADIAASLATIARSRRRLQVLVAYQTVIDGLIAVVARRLFGIPVVVFVRSEEEFRLRQVRQSRGLAPFVFRHADAIAVQTPGLRAALLHELAEVGHADLASQVVAKLHVIPNGVDLPDPGGASGAGDEHAADSPRSDAGSLPEARGCVLYIGRLVPAKGVIHLIQAMRACPGERLVIVGEGPERKRLEQTAQGMANVHFAGRVPPERIPSLLRAARMLVLPSLENEGLPNVVLEAMAAGLPVIASRNAGIPDVVEHGVTGLLTEPGDADSIARAIHAMAESGTARQLAVAARLRVRAHAWTEIIPALEGLLQRIARG